MALLLQIPFYTADTAKTLSVLFMVQSWTTLPSTLPGAWNYPAWTLSVEWFFYLSFPVLLILLSHINRRRLALAVVIMVTVAIDGPQSAFDKTSWLCRHIPLPLLRLPEFFLGMLLAGLPSKKLARANLWTAGVCCATFFLLALNLHRFVLLVVIAFASLIWLLSHQESRLRKALEITPLVLLGSVSYTIYVLQDPLRNWVRLLDSPSSGHAHDQDFLYCLVLLLTSFVVFFGVEQPARKWLRSFMAS